MPRFANASSWKDRYCMRRTKGDYERLLGELVADLRTIDELYAKNRRMTLRLEEGAPDEFDWAALGYTLHGLYCAFEGYFLRIAKFFENGLDPSAWHRELVDRMTLEIPSFRPSLYSREYARRMDELMRFRHAFRNLYVDQLDPRRLTILNSDIPALVADFHPYHEHFIEVLDRIAGEMGKSE
jgi:hypothetical protein